MALSIPFGASDETFALAFATLYDNRNAWNPNDKKRLKEASITDVVCFFLHIRSSEKMMYRELLQEDVRLRYGDVSFAELLTPDRLRKIFQEQ